LSPIRVLLLVETGGTCFGRRVGVGYESHVRRSRLLSSYKMFLLVTDLVRIQSR
jgi:hypothetical protein